MVGKCCCSAGASRGSVVLPVPLSATAGFTSGWAQEARWLGSPCQHSLTTPSPDVSPMDAVSAGTQKDELTLRIVVRMPPQHIIKGVSAGCLGTLTCHHVMALAKGQRMPPGAGCSAPTLHTSALAPRTSSSRSFSWAGPR